MTHSVEFRPAADALDTLADLAAEGIHAQVAMLDPWYNKGVGGVLPDAEYQAFIAELLARAAVVADHVFLWGFPEIVGPLLATSVPDDLELVAWLTWFYKNNPSVIRGWRSAQNACLHLSRPGAPLYPEHFMNEAQKAKQAEGKLRYLPGPPSVIEAGLLVGFIGKAEQTGHPAQKPAKVYEPLLKMTTVPGDLVIDPMCGSGTTGAVAAALGVRAVLCDADPTYLDMARRRLDDDPVGCDTA